MVRGILAFIDREIRGLHEAAYVLAGFALLSQILALIRDRAFAHYFGAGPELDMYFAAFRVPDAAFAFLTLFVSSFALIPLFSSYSKDDRAGVLRSLLLTFGLVAVPVTVVLALSLSFLVPYFVPGFSAEGLVTTTMLARIMLLQPFILGVSSIISAYVQSERRFILFALAPIFYNVGIIVGALFLYPAVGIVGLAWGVVLGALLHLLVQFFPLSVHSGSRHSLSLNEMYRLVVKPSIPRSFALMANQLLLIAYAAVASVITVGAVSSMTFAFNLQSVPLTVIGLSYASALFPALSLMVHKGEWDLYTKEVWATMRHMLFWLLPATMFLIVLRAHIVRVVLGSGAFSWDDTRLTAAILALFTVSLIGQAAILAFSRAYYAAGKTLLPIVLNVGGALLAGILAFYAVSIASAVPFIMQFLEAFLRVSDVPGTLVLMIPATYSFTMLLVALLFGVIFAVRFGFDWSFLPSVGASFTASVLGAGVTYGALQFFEPVLLTRTFLGIFAQGALSGILGLLVWVLVLYLMRSDELRDVVGLVRTRLNW